MISRIKIAGRTLEVLHVEDNPGDAVILKEVLKRAGFPARLNRVADGEEAFAFLSRRAPHFSAPVPDVVLLDLKLPKKDGLTVLNEIRQNPTWQFLPVIILTNSDSDLDLTWAQRYKVDHYVVKPSELDQFGVLVKLLRDYWVKTFQKRMVV
jgi:chemotaxis family two-component system response regulator Rcp1